MKDVEMYRYTDRDGDRKDRSLELGKSQLYRKLLDEIMEGDDNPIYYMKKEMYDIMPEKPKTTTLLEITNPDKKPINAEDYTEHLILKFNNQQRKSLKDYEAGENDTQSPHYLFPKFVPRHYVELVSNSNSEGESQPQSKSNSQHPSPTQSDTWKNPYLKPHVNPSDNTYVEKRYNTHPFSTPERENSVTSFMGGIDLASKQIGHSFNYMLKGVEKALTGSEKHRRQLDKEMQQIADEYAQLPTAKGAAQVSSIGLNIVGVGLPTVIGGMVGGPAVAATVGTGMTAMDVASSGAQADMEVRAYESATGKKVDRGKRDAYITSVMATNLIFDVMAGAKAFKGIAPEVMGRVGANIQKGIFNNPVAQQEFNAMTRQVMKNERKHQMNDMKMEAGKSFVEGGVVSGALEAERGIYTGEAPELSRIVDAALSGAVWNMAQGTLASGVSGKNVHNSRMKRDELYYVSDKAASPDGLPISEIRDLRPLPNPDGGTPMVEGKIVSPGSNQGTTVRVPADNIVQGSYRRADADGATHPTDDHWDIPEERMNEYNAEWERARKLMEENPQEAYAKQNEVVQKIAADMGLSVQVYAHVDDLPEAVLRSGNPGQAYGVTVNNNTPMIILDNCKDLSANNIKSVITHEMVGHKGVRETYDSQEGYDRDISDAYYNMVIEDPNPDKRLVNAVKGGWYMPESDNYNKWLRVAEEKSALMAEKREYVNPQHIPNGMEKMYHMLQRGEKALKNTTVNEMRKDYYRGGNPMPSLYEIEGE